MRLLLLPLLAIAAAVSTAEAQNLSNVVPPPETQTVISGFGDGSQFTTTSVNTPTAITNSALNLTTATSSVAASAFYNTRVSIEAFTASFTFTSSNPYGPGDGFTFTLQNDYRGPSALGTAGGNLGYAGIQPSAAFGINLYSGYPLGTFVLQDGYVPLGYYQPDGTPAGYNQFYAANFNSGTPYTVTLTYANSQLLATITGPDPMSTYQSSYFLDLPFLVGDTMAYVGFTGGTGYAYTAITITDFTFATPVPEPTTWALMGSGLGLVGWAQLRRRGRRITSPFTP